MIFIIIDIKWYGGVLAPNGKIYFTPTNPAQILELDPTTNTTSLIGDVYAGSSKMGWWCISNQMVKYNFTPLNSTQILKLDPTTNITSLIDVYTESSKWVGGISNKW
jgi:hypothetical protein